VEVEYHNREMAGETRKAVHKGTHLRVEDKRRKSEKKQRLKKRMLKKIRDSRNRGQKK